MQLNGFIERADFEKELRALPSSGSVATDSRSGDLFESDYFEKETHLSKNDSQIPLSLSFFRGYEDIGKVISWGTFEGVYRKKDSVPKTDTDFSHVMIESEELTECDSSTLGYKVSVEGSRRYKEYFLLKCFRCGTLREAEEVFDDCEKMNDIAESEGFFSRVRDQKLVVTKEKDRRYFVFTFLEYPDKEKQWESFFDFMEKVKDNYVPQQNVPHSSILQRCSLVYRVAAFLNNYMCDAGLRGIRRLTLIGDDIAQNNIYISKNIQNSNDQISGNQILILGVGQDNPISSHRLQRDLKEMLCFALTYSYSHETARIQRLPCDPLLRSYLFRICQTGQNQPDFFRFSMDDFSLSCDADGIKCRGFQGDKLDIRQLADSGSGVSFTYQEPGGPSLICYGNKYIPFDEEPYELSFYLKDDNTFNVCINEFYKNFTAVLIPGGKSPYTSEQRITMTPVTLHEDDRIKVTVKRSFPSTVHNLVKLTPSVTPAACHLPL